MLKKRDIERHIFLMWKQVSFISELYYLTLFSWLCINSLSWCRMVELMTSQYCPTTIGRRSSSTPSNTIRLFTQLHTMLILYTNMNLVLRNKLHGAMHYTIGVTWLCIQWTWDNNIYSVVITRQSNPYISQFSRSCNEFTSVRSMFPYHTWSISILK